MNPETLALWTMIGTWVSGLGAFSAVLFALRSNKPRLNINFRNQSKLEIVNQGLVNAHISHVYHEISGVTKSKLLHFSPYRILSDFNTREDEPLDKTVSSGDFFVLELNTDELYKSYIRQTCYHKIKTPKHMLRMNICVRLTSGTVYRMSAPTSFYKDVKQRNIYEPEQSIMILTSPNVEVRRPSDSSWTRHCSETLERYMSAYSADMLWQLPKNNNFTKRLIEISFSIQRLIKW